jgi:hypothetical protein
MTTPILISSTSRPLVAHPARQPGDGASPEAKRIFGDWRHTRAASHTPSCQEESCYERTGSPRVRGFVALSLSETYELYELHELEACAPRVGGLGRSRAISGAGVEFVRPLRQPEKKTSFRHKQLGNASHTWRCTRAWTLNTTLP